MKYYSREWNITRGNEYYSREPNITRGNQILLAETKYYSRGQYITRGNEILLAGLKYYSRKCINYSRDRKITCGNEILLAGIQYYSRKWIITRGKKYYSRERIITRGNLFITRGNDILLAGDKYWQYMAPEGFRIILLSPRVSKFHHELSDTQVQHRKKCFEYSYYVRTIPLWNLRKPSGAIYCQYLSPASNISFPRVINRFPRVIILSRE